MYLSYTKLHVVVLADTHVKQFHIIMNAFVTTVMSASIFQQ